MPHPPPSPWSFLPFVALLLSIAVFPLVKRLEHFWEKNLNKLLVALALGLLTLAYYFFAIGPGAARDALHHALIEDYVPFMVLLFSLYTIAGGIHLSGDIRALPSVNTLFLAVGAILASFIGTTGASMLLIRPLLRTNRERKNKVHTVVFFIFLVSNTGGCLTPLGDPPLFLGYLRGVEFWWTLKLFWPWLFVNCLLLLLYYSGDRAAYAHEEEADIAWDVMQVRPLGLHGGLNLLWLGCVVACVALVDPARPLPLSDFKPPHYFREALLLLLAGLSFATPGNRDCRERNEFSFSAVAEVACLFLGIFICMQPPVEYLQAQGAGLGLTTAPAFFWASGGLSSFLDNAPTYVVFFETARAVGAAGPGKLPPVPAEAFLKAISLGSVFMGANTYIGNGPNFMVKTIAEKSGVKMPSFFGYMLYSLLILIPLFLAVTFIFL
jgi:Na+/H+ antiporter NhaD/arsenite permease-like protein